MSMFDPAAFLDATTNEAGSTESVPVPEGEYTGIIKSITPRQWSKKDDPTVSGLAFDVLYELEDDALKALLERKVVTIKQGFMMDLTDGGAIDYGKGKNIAWNRLRDACGLNQPGRPFAPSMLLGQFVKVAVKHRLDDSAAPAIIRADVKGVAKL
jgi:hypothetical protein